MTATFASPGVYPVQLEALTPPAVGRWRPLVLWLLAIPLLVVLYIYGLVAGIVAFIGWFAALFTARLPDSFADVLAGYLRFSWRVNSYLLGFTIVYPSFALPSGRPDPGGNAATLSIAPPTPLSRVRVLFRYFMVLPHLFVLAIVGIAVYAVLIIGWFAVLFTGRWPQGLRRFLVGYFRWTSRVLAFYYMLTDVYPPFSLT